MAATLLAKRAAINISKASPKDQPRYIDSATRIRSASLSTAFERAEGSNAVAETRGEGTGPDGTPGISTGANRDPVSQGIYEAKQQALDSDERMRTAATQFMADTAKEGVKKATEIADTVGDTAKKTMDGACKAAKEGKERIRESVASSGGNHSNVHDDESIEEDPVLNEIQNIDEPVDTAEYRSIKEKIDDLKSRRKRRLTKSMLLDPSCFCCFLYYFIIIMSYCLC